jgi:hypothetical protein
MVGWISWQIQHSDHNVRPHHLSGLLRFRLADASIPEIPMCKDVTKSLVGADFAGLH